MWLSLFNALLGPVMRLFGYGAAAAGGAVIASQRARAQQAEATAQAAQTRATTQDEVARTAPAARREELKRWARK